MTVIDYDRFLRVLTRCVEAAAEQYISPLVTQVYEARAKPAIVGFLAAAQADDRSMSVFSKENCEALGALKDVDGPYRVARSAVMAMVGDVRLPDTLKMQPTDTDKVGAIEKFLDLIDEHAGQP